MERSTGTWDDFRSSFGFLPGIGLLLGTLLGIAVPIVDDVLEPSLPVIEFTSTAAARSLLETIATVTMSVAGLSFSVTLVAFTLAASQLSPRVLRTFQTDRVAQGVLAIFLGAFIYCVVVLLRLGDSSGTQAPDLSLTIAVLLAFSAFAMFAWFLHHIVHTLQPATLIRSISNDARSALAGRFPEGVGTAREDREAARTEAAELMSRSSPRPVIADSDGFLVQIQGEALLSTLEKHDGFLRQHASIGDYVLPGGLLAQLWSTDEEAEGAEEVDDAVRSKFLLAPQRTHAQDVAFAIRQLADVALKALSPGINDPTTAENAMDALTATLVRFAGTEPPSEIREDSEGRPRIVARAPYLDDLVKLGFDQVRGCVGEQPVIAARLLELLSELDRAGGPSAEVERQAELIRAETEAP